MLPLSQQAEWRSLSQRRAIPNRASARLRSSRTRQGAQWWLVGLAVLALSELAGANPVLSSDLLQRDVRFQERAFDDAHIEAIESLDLATDASITQAGTQFLALLDRMPDGHPHTESVQLNAAIALAAAGEVEAALELAQAALDSTRNRAGPYDLRLIPFMLAEGDVLVQNNQVQNAVSAYQRAQNVTHRQLGVFTPAQMPAIDRVIAVAFNMGPRHVLETQLKMSLRVAQESMTPRMVATKQLALADHYKRRTETTERSTIDSIDTPGVPERLGLGQIAVGYYNDAITTLTTLDDPERLLYAMQSAAETWSLVDRPRSAKRAAMRFLAKARETYGDTSTQAGRALVTTGDIYMLSRDHRFNDHYAEAWAVLEADPDLREQLLGAPHRLSPNRIRTFTMARRPAHVGPNEPLIVRLAYTVRPDGRAGRINIMQSNVLAEERRVSRSILKRMVFRPRIENGVAVATAHQEHVQPFRVGAPDALFPWNQKRHEEKRAEEQRAAEAGTE